MFNRVAAAALGLSVLAGPALAQNVNANNLVSVTISEALVKDIANDLNLEVSDIVADNDQNSLTVQAPIGIAANVCDVTANVLATSEDEPAECEAKSTSEALNKIVQRSATEQ